jgi:imidazolonepropionase-like amidohydrolase
MRTALLAAAVASALAAGHAHALTIACGQVFDSATAKLLGPHTLVIADGRISALKPGLPPAGSEFIDHAGQTCLPGLIDLHTHISYMEAGPASYSEGYRLNPGDYALRGALNAKKTLRAGFTTIRDLGDTDGASVAVRNAINEGVTEGPRIFTAGKSIATTGGHADQTNGSRRDLAGQPGPREGVINGPEEAHAAVRYRYKESADLIKITATGGVLSYAKNGLNPQFTQEEANAIVAAAQDYGFAVAAHAHGKEGIRRAILAGVTTIEHGSFLEADLIPLIKEHGTWLVPTLLAGDWVGSKAGEFPPMVAAKARAIGPLLSTNFKRAHQAGVKIAFGTDSGVSPHGMNAREFRLMVDAGMPANVAIQTATRNAAEVLDMSADIGSLDSGRYADIVVVDGDPLVDVTVLEKPVMTYKGGVAYAPMDAAR